MYSTLWSLLSVLFYLKRPGLNFPQKVSIKQPGLTKLSRASVHQNQGNLDFFGKVSIKRPVLSQFQILNRSLKLETIEYVGVPTWQLK